MQQGFLGFAAGVMIAASVWSLLIPAIEQAEAAGGPGWLPAAGGFVLGVGFLLALDHLMPHLHPGAAQCEGPSCGWRRTTLLVSAVTLHNIPEGMAVGLSFALAAQTGEPAALATALALAAGMGIQNFPEGGGHLVAAAAGRAFPHPQFCVRKPVGDGGTGVRHGGGAGGGRHPAADALAAGLCPPAPCSTWWPRN